MAAPLYHDINGYKGRHSKTNRISRLLADGLGASHKDQRLTDKKLSPGNPSLRLKVARKKGRNVKGPSSTFPSTPYGQRSTQK